MQVLSTCECDLVQGGATIPCPQLDQVGVLTGTAIGIGSLFLLASAPEVVAFAGMTVGMVVLMSSTAHLLYRLGHEEGAPL